MFSTYNCIKIAIISDAFLPTKGADMNTFSKRDTSIIKGLAVLMLICHHLGMGILPAPIDWFNDPFLTIIATLCKVCVAVFVVLSGYGINESRKRYIGSDFSFVKNHLLKLMKQYWFIFVIFVPLGFLCQASPIAVYGTGLKGFLYLIIDFVGMKSLFNTPTMNQTWWYMEAVIVLYIFYPVLKRLLKRLPVLVLAVTFIPIIYFNANPVTVDGCREIYWFFPFAVGILLSEHDVPNSFSRLAESHFSVVCAASVVAVIAMTYVRSYFGIIADTFYALAIIAFCKVSICRIKYVSSVFDYLGFHSANIFMMHSFLYCYYVPIKQLLFVVPSALFNFLFLTLECVVVSDYIEILKKRIGPIAVKQKNL